MEANEVTDFLKKILRKSDSLQYCEHFKGISDEKFKSYSFEELKSVLPSTEEGELAAAEIKAQIEVALMMDRVKAEKRAGGNVSSFFQEEIKVEGTALDESQTGADGISVGIVPREFKEIQVVTLDSDQEEVYKPQGNSKPCVSSDEDSSDSEDLSSSESSESDDSDADGPCPKRQRKIESTSTTEPPVGAHTAEIQPVLILGSSSSSTYKCTGSRMEGQASERWYDEIHGQHCTTIIAYRWCWRPLNHRCKDNLFRILCNSPNLKELNLFNDVNATPANIEIPEGSLLKLKKLIVHRRRNMNFGNLLRSILTMATNLKRFEYKFSIETEDDLRHLGDSHWPELQRLSVFSLSSPSYLAKIHLESLLRVRAPKLRDLEMGIGLYEDVSGDLLENVLKNFPTIQTLYIPGQYYSHADTPAEVTINFPKLSQLRDLYLGGKYSYVAIRIDGQNEKLSALEQASTSPKPFHVTLKFCRIFSRLKTLILGNMYHIDNLHLKCFPKLEEFLVGSPWHLSVCFSGKKAQNYSYPLITNLQLPDELNDTSFLRNIPERFPNVKTCRLRLPSAHVLRAFFNVMKDVGLKELCLTTRFDFSSTLESCFLDKVRPVNKFSKDWKRVTELEKCEKWDEFVNQYNIILPLRNDEEVKAFVEATGEHGLGAMKQLDKFYLWHVPRMLRLPKLENNEAATTSTVKLGYSKYPISTECCDVVQLTSTQFRWNLKEPAGERERWKEAGQWASLEDFSYKDVVKIEAVPAIQSNLKEEKKDE